ncbi:hypothetical protein ACFYO9_14140 [Streptomyces sp. NPDC005863]|uniref:hypothetical protein n=1 Tax=unclassified Streptomyces TaxID=2593676 RepID=UPI0033C59FA6
MSDVYALDLAFDLSGSTPAALIDDLCWHLGISSGRSRDETEDEWPLLAARGTGLYIGGTLVNELTHADDSWHLTVRQEVHEESLPEVISLLRRLVAFAGSEGIVGQIRFYEDEAPELLLNEAGILTKGISQHNITAQTLNVRNR